MQSSKELLDRDPRHVDSGDYATPLCLDRTLSVLGMDGGWSRPIVSTSRVSI